LKPKGRWYAIYPPFRLAGAGGAVFSGIMVWEGWTSFPVPPQPQYEQIGDEQKRESRKGCGQIARKELPGPKANYAKDKDKKDGYAESIHGVRRYGGRIAVLPLVDGICLACDST